jgi:hypothetical protein
MAQERPAADDIAELKFSETKGVRGGTFHIHKLPYVDIEEPYNYEIHPHKQFRYTSGTFVMRGDIESKIEEIYNEVCLKYGCQINYTPIIIDPKCKLSCDGMKITKEKLLKKKNHTAKIRLSFIIYKEKDHLRLRYKVTKINLCSPSKPLAVIPQHMLDMFKQEHKNCSICVESIEKDAYITGCYHLFHATCISKWFKRDKTCPTCRAKQ